MEADKMELKLYNTMTQKKEVFIPINPEKIGLYVCGTTEEGSFQCDIGHARVAVSYDVLYRYLKRLGYEVNFVRIFADVDDKIIRDANKNGEEPIELSDRLYKEYLVEMEALQCLRPTKEPRVSQHMDEIIAMIGMIIEKGCGYHVDGDVFFSVEKSLNYGKLTAGRLHTRASKRVAVDPKKLNSADFALWKAAKPGELSWGSPWGKGRPGRYIACSAMSAHYLSPKFDIHGGGEDLEFPHHENELAQTCAACEAGGVNYWLHNKTVKLAKAKEKTIREMKRIYHPLALRHFLMSEHYRSPLYSSTVNLNRSSEALYDIYQTLQNLSEAFLPYRQAMAADGGKAQQTAEAKDFINKLKSDFEAKMLDDLNTAHVLTGAYQDALKFINASIGKLKEMQKKQRMSLLVSLVEIEKAAKEVLDVLGLLTPLTYAEILREMIQINEAREEARLDREATELMELKKKGASLHFIDMYRSVFYQVYPRTKLVGKMIVGAGDKWRAMSSADKRPFEQLAEKDYDSVYDEYKKEYLIQKIKLREDPYMRCRSNKVTQILRLAKDKKKKKK